MRIMVNTLLWVMQDFCHRMSILARKDPKEAPEAAGTSAELLLLKCNPRESWT